jgi:hypothetical protein
LQGTEGEVGTTTASIINKFLGLGGAVDFAGGEFDKFKGKTATMGDGITALGY